MVSYLAAPTGQAAPAPHGSRGVTTTARRGLFVAEGTSDLPIADLVETMFAARGVVVDLSRPDLSRLTVAKDVSNRVEAGIRLMAVEPSVVVIHRDADNAGSTARQQEIRKALGRLGFGGAVVPVIPVRMTEARSPSWRAGGHSPPASMR